MKHRSYLLELTPEHFRPAPRRAAELRIVRASARNAARARRLWMEVGCGFWTERSRWRADRWRQYLRDAAVSFWIASCHGEDVGFFELRARGANVKLEGFGLLPAWRGKRLGSALLTLATERAFARGATRIWLHTATDDHPNALPNYQARGYRIHRESVLRRPMPRRRVADAPATRRRQAVGRRQPAG